MNITCLHVVPACTEWYIDIQLKRLHTFGFWGGPYHVGPLFIKAFGGRGHSYVYMYVRAKILTANEWLCNCCTDVFESYIIMKAVKSDLRVDVHAVNLFCNLLNNQE